MKFCSFASGSAGNCYYVGTDNAGILIDAGISERRIKNALKKINVPLETIHAVFVTHDHLDHVSAIGRIGEKNVIPVYTSAVVHSCIERNSKIQCKLSSCKRIIEKYSPVNVADFSVTAFQLYHDTKDCMGYYIESGGTSLAIATDLGYINKEAAEYLLKADNIIIEANYNEQMLINGDYAPQLKHRILSQGGHLPNHETAAFLSSHGDRAWKRVFFCHLSEHNNSPEQVLQDVNAAYDAAHVAQQLRPILMPLPRYQPTELFEL